MTSQTSQFQRTGLPCTILFVDVCGSTQLYETLGNARAQAIIAKTLDILSQAATRHLGTIIKTIGDEVMWVSGSPERLVQAAVDLVDHPKAREEGLQVRAGLAYGTVLAINGDYFGNPVNLAARLVAAAAPEQILATSELHDELPNWPAVARGPLTLKGFDTPVTAFELHRGDAVDVTPACGD